MSEFIHQDQLRPRARMASRSISSNVRLRYSSLRRGMISRSWQCLSLRPAVGLNDAIDHINAFPLAHLRSFEHGIRLPNSWDGPEKNLQPSAPLLLCGREKCFGGRTKVWT